MPRNSRAGSRLVSAQASRPRRRCAAPARRRARSPGPATGWSCADHFTPSARRWNGLGYTASPRQDSAGRRLDPGNMERQLKERIVGATVIVALGIIVIPWLLDGPAQSSRPVEQAIELPPADAPGRTYSIPLDPGAGPAVQVGTGGGDDVVRAPADPGAGAVQRPASEAPPPPTSRSEDPPADATVRPVQPAPRPASEP